MIIIMLPIEAPSQNAIGGRGNWRANARATKERRRESWMWCSSEMRRVGCPPAAGPRTLRMTFYRNRKCLDIANLIAGTKALTDGLVDAGLLLDDRDSMARIHYAQELASKGPTGRPCTVIQVEDGLHP